jgi:hypothetical protein
VLFLRDTTVRIHDLETEGGKRHAGIAWVKSIIPLTDTEILDESLNTFEHGEPGPLKQS